MSDTTPTSDKKPKPIFNPDDVVEPDTAAANAKVAEAKADAADAKADAAAAKSDAEAAAKADTKTKAATKPAPKTDAKADAAGTATGDVAPADAEMPPAEAPAAAAPVADSDFAGREVVYVQAPVPPRLRSNRGLGSALAVLGAVLFAAIFAGAVTLAFAINNSSTVGSAFTDFIQNAAFWVPVLVFLVAFVLLVLIVNRAGWAAHVFGSLLVALAVYFGSIGILLLLGAMIGAGEGEALGSFAALAANPIFIIAALVAREVSIWIGLAIAARGRRVRERNHEIVDEWEREQAETKSQYERAAATS